LKNKPIRLIKWSKVGMKNLFIIPSLKRRIGQDGMRDDRRGDRQKPPCPSKIAPTSPRSRATLKVDDYG